MKEPAMDSNRPARLTSLGWAACFVLAACLALAVGTLFPVAAAAQGDLCRDCNLEQLKQDYQTIYAKATAQYQEVAEWYEDAADDSQAALEAGVDLVGLPSLAGNLEEACDVAVESALGGISTATTALDGLASTLLGLVGEDEAKDKLATANSTAWLARMAKECIDACCKRLRTAREYKFVRDNPDVDWTVEQPEARIRECLDRLSSGERLRLMPDLERRLFEGYMHPKNIEVMKTLGE